MDCLWNHRSSHNWPNIPKCWTKRLENLFLGKQITVETAFNGNEHFLKSCYNDERRKKSWIYRPLSLCTYLHLLIQNYQVDKRQIHGSRDKYMAAEANTCQLRQIHGSWGKYMAAEIKYMADEVNSWQLRQMHGRWSKYLSHEANTWQLRQILGSWGKFMAAEANAWQLRQIQGSWGINQRTIYIFFNFIFLI